MEVYGGSSRKKYVSAADIKKLKNGGIKADAVRKKSNLHHETVDVPNAEKILEEQIDSAYAKVNTQQIADTKITELTIWQKIKNFFIRLITPPDKEDIGG